MGYIGNQTSNSYSSIVKQDLTGETGSPVKRGFILDHPVANASEIEVFVNNVRQKPEIAYTVSGTGLTMTGDVETTDDFYVVFQGKAIQTTVPPDDSVTTARINDGAVTTAKLADGSVTAAKLTAGTVIQTKTTVMTAQRTVTGSSYSNITGLSLSITPTSTSSKIVITACVPSGVTSGGERYYFTIRKGTTNLVVPDGTLGNRVAGLVGDIVTNADINNMSVHHLMIVDEPSTTSSVTYNIAGSVTGSATLHINQTGNDADSAYRARGVSTMTLMEIAG
jgi:hypothetical protein